MMLSHDRHTRYRHKKTYYFLKNGKTVGIVPIDVKLTPEELKKELEDCKAMFSADTVILHWTSQKGIMDEVIQI